MSLKLMEAVMLIGMTARAAEPGNHDLTVKVFWSPACADLFDAIPAKAVATRIFNNIGVHLEWIRRPKGKSRLEDFIVIEMIYESRPDFHPGAMAFAYEFEGRHISILYDRVKAASTRQNRADVLGHVLAHEIAHLLQRTNYHAAAGVMKKEWDHQDYRRMCVRPLSFTPFDVQLIYGGLRKTEICGNP